MNANEVIATLAARAGTTVHPNDHVNASQSSNDVFPTTIHLAATEALATDVVPALEHLAAALRRAGHRLGRRRDGGAHAPDGRRPDHAGPGGGRLGDAGRVRRRPRRATCCRGSASCRSAAPPSAPASTPPPASARRVVAQLRAATGLDVLSEAPDHIEAQGARDGLVEASGALRTVAVSLYKIANDIRWLSSGPRTGLAELHLPDLQPGSSIMPGKVNPVICEATMMVAAQVIGNDATVAFSGSQGNLQLNVMMPVMARNVLESARLLAAVARLLADKVVDGAEPDVERDPRVRRVLPVHRHPAQPLPRLRGGGRGRQAVAQGAQDDPRGRDRTRSRACRARSPSEQLDEALDVLAMARGGKRE